MKKIVEEDAFGYERKQSWDGIQVNADFDFPSRPQKVSAFMKWLRELQDREILEVHEGEPIESASNRSWQNLYLRSAYQKGLGNSAAQLRKGGVTVTDRWINAAFYRPFHADRMGLIFTRAYSDLEGITKTMDTKLSRILAMGIQDGLHPRDIAKTISKDIESIGVVRARMLARTETISAHAEASLNTYEEAGIEGVDLLSEFQTAQDNKVCPRCEELEGKTFTVDGARGIIPVHPNCRCAWLPKVGEGSVKELL